jgi:hypothetical protein
VKWCSGKSTYEEEIPIFIMKGAYPMIVLLAIIGALLGVFVIYLESSRKDESRFSGG